MKSVKRLRILGLTAAWTLVFALNSGCEKHADQPAPVVAAPLATRYAIKMGDSVAQLQIAVNTGEMEVGLMNRTDLGPDDGMIFVYAEPQRMSFWMRNTPTALDIGFFSPEGILREVYPMYPHDETSVPSMSEHVQFAVEMKQGWYAQHGVRPGAQLDRRALAAAVKARGFDLKNFGALAADLAAK